MRVAKARVLAVFVAFASAAAFQTVLGCGGSETSRAADDAGALVDAPTADAPARSDEDAAADDAGADAPEGAADAGVELAPLHIVGRFDARDALGPRLGWPGTQIRARFSGGSLALVLADTGVSYYDVSIDGASPSVLVVSGEERVYDIADNLAPGEHEVVLTKRTEGFTGTTQLRGVVGTLVPSPVPSGRRIELVGDSITCGYGVLGDSAMCSFSPETESEALAWGALAADELGALHVAAAVSGLGVLRNYDGSTTDTMPDRYDRALPNDPSSMWSHDAFVPDVIVVNLGTNDFSGGKGDPGLEFEAAYTTFLTTLRARHPAAHIVVSTSPMLGGDHHVQHRAYLESAIAARFAAGDTKLTLLALAEQSKADGYGCDWHPSIGTHRKMADDLVAHLKPLMGW